MIAEGRDEDLRLVLQAPERLGMDNSIAVALEVGTQRGRSFPRISALGASCPGSMGGEQLFPCFQSQTYAVVCGLRCHLRNIACCILGVKSVTKADLMQLSSAVKVILEVKMV